MVALELDTNDGHGTIKSEPAPRKRENWIENHEPILNPKNQLFDLAISKNMQMALISDKLVLSLM
jgi:hypothetical protein